MKKFVLCFLSLIYEGMVWLRNRAYDVLPLARAVDVPVISVGNIVAGGTGKTPITIAIAQSLQEQNGKVAILSRGYKGKRPLNKNCVSDGQTLLLSAVEAGDEPRMMAEALPQVPVYVEPNRVLGAQQILQNHAIDALILDDAFQHRRIKRDVDIVLINAMDPWGGGAALPLGRRRESLTSLRRADIVLLTKTECVDPEICEEIIAYIEIINPGLDIFSATTIAKSFSSLDGSETHSLETIKNKRILLLSSIAQPEAFERIVTSYQADIIEHCIFPDHYSYEVKDWDQIQTIVREKNIEYVVTTHKDAVKIQDNALPCSLLFLIIEFKIDADFFRCIQHKLTR